MIFRLGFLKAATSNSTTELRYPIQHRDLFIKKRLQFYKRTHPTYGCPNFHGVKNAPETQIHKFTTSRWISPSWKDDPTAFLNRAQPSTSKSKSYARGRKTHTHVLRWASRCSKCFRPSKDLFRFWTGKFAEVKRREATAATLGVGF